ncbi:hypothetical protein [Tissierella pigra]|uniref:Uncharacterized protein n=1 Tax=Tissierella pigra TaxID=2607614 RepID=A0A6N7XSI8_9FIRM|nr:hypothetical protein [Tissierella pigra]MSU00383.1 hypothetical protein [Tissierella pigra]
MNDYKNSKWASDIIDLQKDDGSWGYFHTLSEPSKQNPITTEQAIRRLEILGYTINDSPIIKAVSYMQDCLAGKKEIPDRKEKLHNWNIFTTLMLSTWIRRFTKDDNNANNVARKWIDIISHAFEKGVYDNNIYIETYQKKYKLPPRGGRLLDLSTFYQISLIANSLEDEVAVALFDYVLQHQSGIYYIYDKKISVLPELFKSKQASRYIGAIELLSKYKNPGCKNKLEFVVEWLNNNKEPEGFWDMGTTVKDGVRFPLSDSWRSKDLRIKDCTYRISNVINKIKD